MSSERQRPPAAAPGKQDPGSVVCVVDDDEAVRDSLGMLLESVGYEVRQFVSASDFLDTADPATAGCLVLDVRMPGMSGLDLQRQLAARDAELPIVFITGHGDVPMAVRAVQDGAVDFLEKPYKEQDLLDAVAAALALGSRRRRQSSELEAVNHRLESLTPRERQVLELVVAGSANKVIASRLGTSRRTVEIHRANVMRKMKADSLAHLVRMVVGATGGGATLDRR